MIEPKGLSNTLLTQLLLVQFGGDNEVLVIPVSVTKVIISSVGDLDKVVSQPEA